MLRGAFSISLAATLSASSFFPVLHAQSTDPRIARALAAAPAAISSAATVMAKDASGKMLVLRRGTNGWTCMPGGPPSERAKNTAMCMDASFGEFMAAMKDGKTAALKRMGVAYMLTTDQWVSNTDPSAKSPAPNNDWHHVAGAVMLAYPDRASLKGLPVKPVKDGPYVMWADTPYAHVMLPTK